MRHRYSLLLSTMLCWSACQSTPPPSPPPIEWPERPAVAAKPASDPQVTVAEQLQKEQWTLEDVLQLTEAFNPELAVEARNVDLATAALWEARLYPNPELTLGVEDYRTRDGATLSHSKRTMGVNIPIVIGGRIGAATSAAESERDVAAIHFVWRRREILGRSSLAFIEILAAQRSLSLTRETRDIARAFRDAAQERFDAQAIPEMEVLKADVNLSKAESEVMFAEKAVVLATKALATAIGRSDLPSHPIRGDLTSQFSLPGLDVLEEQLISRHPLLEEANKIRAAAESQLSLARAERIPDLGFAISAGKDSEDENIVQAGITIPLGLFNRNQAKIEAASIRVEQSARRIASTLNDLQLRLDEVYRNVGTAQQRVSTYQMEILPKAQRALDQTNEGFRLGKFAFLDVLDAQRTLAEARSAYTAAATELNLGAAELERLTGVHLEPMH